MNTSKAYIKMCDHPKIQGQWKPKSWSSYHVWHTRLKEVGDIIYGRDWEHSKGELIWLPRQDQIQEMMKITDGYYFFHSFANKVFSNEAYPYYRNKTPEQIWLAFYMEEKHQLVWSTVEEVWTKK